MTSVEILEEMGEETDGVVESTSKLQEKLKALTGVDILTDTGAYKDTYTVLKEIGEVWQDMDSLDQSAALELMAGKNRANTLSAILNNMKDLKGAYESALGAEGSALKENAAYLDSIQGRIDLFNNAVQTMWMNFIDSEVVKFIVDVGTGLVKLVDHVGVLTTALAGVGTYFFAIKKNNPVTMFKDLVTSMRNYNNMVKQIQSINDVFGSVKSMSIDQFNAGPINAYAAAVSNLTAKQQAATLAASGLNSEQIASVLAVNRLDAANIRLAMSEANVAQAKTQTAAATGVQAMAAAKQQGVSLSQQAANFLLAHSTEEVTKKMLAKAVVSGQISHQDAALIVKSGILTSANHAQALSWKALGTSMKAAFMSNPVGMIVTLASTILSLIPILGSFGNTAKEAMRELTESAIKSAKETKETQSSLADYKDEVNELRDALDSNTLSESEAYSARERLLEIQNQLIDKFGLEAKGINLVTGELQKQLDVMDALTRQAADDWFKENSGAYAEAKKVMAEEYDSERGLLLFHQSANRAQYEGGTLYGSSQETIDEYKTGIQKLVTEQFGGTTSSPENTAWDQLWASWEDKTVEEIIEFLDAVQQYMLDFEGSHPGADLAKDIERVKNFRDLYATEDYKKSRELYNEGRQQEAIKDYALQYDAILDSEEELLSADTDKERLDAISEYKTKVEEAIKEANKNGETHMADYFSDMLEKYEAEEIELKIKLDDDGFKTDLENIVKQSGEKGLSALDDLAIDDMIKKGLNVKGATDESGTYTAEQIQGLVALQAMADETGVSLEQLISLMVQYKLIAGQPVETSDSEQVVKSVKTYSDLVEQMTNYNDVLAQTSEIVTDNTEVTQEYKDALLALGISSDELNECFDDTQELVVKDAKALNNLVKSAKNNTTQNIRLAKSQAKLEYYELYKEIQRLTNGQKVNDQATLSQINSLYAQMTAIQKTIAQYSLLEETLLGSTNAYAKLAEAQEMDETADYGSKAEELVNVLAEAFNTSQLGTEAAQVAIAGLIPDEVFADADTLDEKMQKIYEYFTGGEVSKLFTIEFDDDGGISGVEMTKENVEKFTQSLIDADKVFHGTWDEFTLDESIKTLDQFASALGVTKEVAIAYLTELEKYDISWLGGDGSTLLDHFVPTSESIDEFGRNMNEAFSQGSIDLTVRPRIDASVMQEAGWDVPDDSYSTVNTVTYTASDFGLAKKGSKDDYAINVTPILPDGTVIQGGDNGLRQYIFESLESGKSLKDLPIFLGMYQTIADAETAAKELHEVQEEYYSMLDSYSLENDIYRTTQDMAELEHQMANGKITAEEYSKEMAVLKDKEEQLGQRARDTAKQYAESNDELSKAYDELAKYRKQLQDGKDEDGNIIDKQQVEQDIAEVSERIIGLTKKIYALGGEPTQIELEFARKGLDEEIESVKQELTEKLAANKIEITGVVEFDKEKGEWTIINDAYKDDELVNEYVELQNLSEDINSILSNSMPTVETHLSDIKSILTNIQTILAGEPTQSSDTTSTGSKKPGETPYNKNFEENAIKYGQNFGSETGGGGVNGPAQGYDPYFTPSDVHVIVPSPDKITIEKSEETEDQEETESDNTTNLATSETGDKTPIVLDPSSIPGTKEWLENQIGPPRPTKTEATTEEDASPSKGETNRDDGKKYEQPDSVKIETEEIEIANPTDLVVSETGAGGINPPAQAYDPMATITDPSQIEPEYTPPLIIDMDAADDEVLLDDDVELQVDTQDAEAQVAQIEDQVKEAFTVDGFVTKEGLSDLQLDNAFRDVGFDSLSGNDIFSFDPAIFTQILTEAGYAEEKIASLIAKIQEYKSNVIVGDNDPLGLYKADTNAASLMDSLGALGVKYDNVLGAWGDGKRDLKINLPSLVDALRAAGWTNESILSYISTLEQIEIDKFNIKLLGQDEVNNALDDIDTRTLGDKTVNVEVIGATETERVLENVDKDAGDVTKTVTIEYKTIGSTGTTRSSAGGGGRFTESTVVGVNGTAHAQGTAYKSGDWGAEKSTTALVGELGPEMVVRGNRWFLVGENGASFEKIKRNDIIFNHKQTESLLSNGYVTGRGKAYASGTVGGAAFASIDTWDNAHGKLSEHYGNTSGSEAADDLSGAAKDIEDAADEFREVFDWIEVRLEEINDDLALQGAQLENKVGASAQNAVIDDMIDTNKLLYDNLIAGANKYYSYAQTLLAKIPSEYRKAAQDGSIAIETFVGEVDEKTLEAIQEYREWVQKGDDLTTQAEETLTEISTLAKQAIDNIAAEFDNQRSIGDSRIEQLEAMNEFLETDQGYESASIYQQMIDENNANIAILRRQRNAMQEELNRRVESGEIKVNSEAWYEAVNDIAAVDTEIITLQTDNENLQDSINELRTDKFEELLRRVEAVSDEAGDLIDILSNEELVDDNGNWTDEGIASLGLHAQRMEAAEVQAQKLADEIAYLDQNWKKLGYTEDEYLQRRDELKDQQYDAIKSYHEEKDAIVDLNKERVDAIKKGIEKEVEAYRELIEAQKEALESEKDLHDFQRTIEDKQQNIDDIRRKLDALSTDNSASARAQRAKLQAELAEAEQDLQDTYYDRSITDQQNALDKELENFEEEKDAEMEGWDEYLENTNQVVADSLATVQANTDAVYQTLLAMGEEYSISITESLVSPWREGENAIQSFAEQFGVSMSATVDELRKLEVDFLETMLNIENAGKHAADTVKENFDEYTDATYTEPNKPKTEDPSTTDEDKQTEQYTTYTVKSGDNLSKIAKKKLGSSNQWKDIYNANKDIIQDPDRIYPGQKLKIPKKIAKYAKGTLGTKKNELAWIDELGLEEVVLHAGANGRLEYLTKGSSVIPSDISENLMQLGQLDPQAILDQNRPEITMSPSIVNNNMEINMEISEVVHIDTVTNDTLPNLTKAVEKQMDKYMKDLNAKIRRYSGR